MMASAGQRSSRELRSFGRKRGRGLSARQQRLMAGLLPKVSIDTSVPAPAQLSLLFTSHSDSPPARGERGLETWLEIGFGGGEHLVWQAEHNPSIALIGCEPFEDGVVKVLTAIEEKHLSNIRVHADDARPLLRWLPESSIGRAFILFPDPWPKKKHAKRRLVSGDTLTLLARVMRPGAELRMATDIGDYARTMLLAVRSEPRLRWTALGPSDWRQRGADWPQTRYEAKAMREGRTRYFFRFKRV